MYVSQSFFNIDICNWYCVWFDINNAYVAEQQLTDKIKAIGTACTTDIQCGNGALGLYCSPFNHTCQTGSQICLSLITSTPAPSEVVKGACGSVTLYSSLGDACIKCFGATECDGLKWTRCSSIVLESGGYIVHSASRSFDNGIGPGLNFRGAFCLGWVHVHDEAQRGTSQSINSRVLLFSLV